MKKETVTLSREQATALAFADASNGATASQLVAGWKVMAELRTALADPVPMCSTPTGARCPGDGVKECKKCPVPPAGGDDDSAWEDTFGPFYEVDEDGDGLSGSVSETTGRLPSDTGVCGGIGLVAGQPLTPAGGDVEVLGYSVKGNRYMIRRTKGELLEMSENYMGDVLIELVDRAHVTRLQAEVERLKQTAESWEPIHDDDLTEGETFLNTRLKDAMFFPTDARTLANIAMHCIREVRATRFELTKARELLTEWLDSNFTGSCPARNSLRCRTDYALAHQSAPAAKCSTCDGSGRLHEKGCDPGDCSACDGTGRAPAAQTAPVAVVLPEQLTSDEIEELEVIEAFLSGQGLSNLAGAMASARQFIEEVSRLNGKKP